MKLDMDLCKLSETILKMEFGSDVQFETKM